MREPTLKKPRTIGSLRKAPALVQENCQVFGCRIEGKHTHSKPAPGLYVKLKTTFQGRASFRLR